MLSETDMSFVPRRPRDTYVAVTPPWACLQGDGALLLLLLLLLLLAAVVVSAVIWWRSSQVVDDTFWDQSHDFQACFSFQCLGGAMRGCGGHGPTL